MSTYPKPLSSTESMVLSATGFAGFVAVWFLVSHSGLVEPRMLPGPDQLIVTFFRLLREPFAGFTLEEHLLSSLTRYFLGFGLAVLIGVPLGVMMGWFGWLDDLVTPFFEVVRFVAPIAWVPFAVLWFGTGIGGPLLIIFSGAFPPCLINAYRGARLVDRRIVEAVRTLGASDIQIMRDVLVPGSIPSIVAGIRVAAGIGWQSLVGAELIVVSSGVGYLMVQGQANFATDIVVAGMATIGLIGMLIDVVLRFAERRMTRKWA